jgi:hypothetical protein
VAATAPAQPPRAIPANPPPAAQIVDSAAQAQAAFEARRRQDEEKAAQQAALQLQQQKEILAQAALAEQKRQEEAKQQAALAEQKRQERNKLVDDLATALSEQTQQITAFNSNCHARLNADTNLLAKIQRSHRAELAAKINNVHRVAFIVSTNQTAVQIDLLHSLQTLKDDPQADAQKFKDEEQATVARMEKSRLEVASMLDELDTDLSNAPKSRPLFDFNIK